jgi:long-chain acyl-CoA synthetase
VLITDPRDMNSLVAELRRTPFSFITGVNTLFSALLAAPGFERLDFSRLQITMGGGMAVQSSVAQAWKKVTGNTLTQGYGLTETSPIVCANPFDAPGFNGSVGLPLPSTEVSIRDEDGRELEAEEVGEICVRGPQVMAGYWNKPDETAAVLGSGGWLRTGDIGHIDARGYVYVEDRKKDMVIVSGFNVYPNEIEDVVVEHPGVLEAAVIGVPDRHSGEAVKLFVVKKDPRLTEKELVAYCRERLTGYKIPRRIEFLEELPKSNVGKVLRRALRERSAQNARS